MSEPEDGGWSDGSADMDVDDIDNSSETESDSDDAESIADYPIVPPTVRSSARLSTRLSTLRSSLRGAAQSSRRAYNPSTRRSYDPSTIPSPPRSPVGSPGRAPEVNFYTVSGDSVDSIDSEDSVNYQVADLNRFELGYIQPFPLNLHRSGGYSETLSVAPSGSIQEETQQSTGSIENHSPINVSTLNQSSTRSYVESQMETTEYVPTPTTSEETSEDTKNTLNEYSCTEDASTCPICLEPLNNVVGHRAACLKCGHIFGESCIDRWIKVVCSSDGRRCPTCNTKANAKDIRVLYVKKLVAVDTVELSRVQNKLKQEQDENDAMKIEINNWKIKNCTLREEVKRLKTIVDKMVAGVPPSSIGPTSGRQCLKRIKIHGANPSCRVMAFNRNNMLLVVSQQGEPPFINSHAIRKLNALILEPTKEYIYAHKKQIRDMSFHPIDHNQLVTVSLDKCVCLTDLSSNAVVSSVEVDEPLWSCCWAGNNTNMLVAGSQMGSLFYLDRRYMKLLHADINRKPACVSLSPIPASASRKYPSGGFLKTRMDFLSIFEQDFNHDTFCFKENPLSLKGKWSSSAYDIQSNLLLTSTKPCGINQSVRHIVSKLSGLSEEPIIQPVVTFYGGDLATQLTRSCFVPSTDSHEDLLVCGFDEKSKTIKIFNVSTNTNIHNFSVKEKFTDLCPLNGVSMNGRRTLAGLSECGVSIFSV